MPSTHTGTPNLGRSYESLPAFTNARPASFDLVARWPVQFVTFFPFNAAIRRGIVRVADHQSLEPDAAAFPLFRAAGMLDRVSGQALDWWLWDGEREWRLDRALTDEERDLPLRGIINDTMLIERLETGWKPADEK